MTQRFYLSLLAIIIINLSACGPAQQTKPTQPTIAPDIAAIEAEQSGHYLAAAELYLALAETANKAQQAEYYLNAALDFWQANQAEQANATLIKVETNALIPSSQVDASILGGQLALADSQAERALRLLDSVQLQSLAPEKQQHVLELRIQAYGLTNNFLEKANSHIALAPLLPVTKRGENQQELWQALMVQTSQALDLFNPGTPPAVDSGWFALAYIIKTYQANFDTMMVALEDWHRNYPSHPADPELYKDKIKAGTHIPQTLNHIAILLPESGPYKKAANAIKKGIIAAHFNAKSRTQLHFYNVVTDQQSGVSNVWQQYQYAIVQNASIVIGPLDKKAVQLLADTDALTIPVLALNRLTEQHQQENLFQFGLAPEDDAIAAANYATEKEFIRALVISPDNSWGDRVSAAFNDQWLNNGGTLLGHAKYESKQNDFSDTIKPLLGLNVSTQRYKSLKQTLATSIEFEPRRRQDIDFIFLVAKPLKARQIVPQLKFHRSGKVPILATSQVFSGKEDSQQDIDLNGLFINDIPWMFTENAISDPIYTLLKSNKSTHFERFLRLHALGADAYQLIPQLNSLSRSSDLNFNGATGILSINEYGQIQRKTPWGKFTQGILTPLPTTTEQ